MTSRRRFLRLALAAAGAAAFGQLPVIASAQAGLTLSFPQDPFVTYFANTFGAPRPGGRRHLGIDLMAPKHSPVFAAAAGVVSVVSDGPRSGRYLRIDHADGWSTWYMHLNNDRAGTDNGRADWSETLAAGVEEGRSVAAGQLIGYVGDSGNAEGSGAHTHFELHRYGRIVNPFSYLVEAFDRALVAWQEQALSDRVEALCLPSVADPAVDLQVCPVIGPVDVSFLDATVID